MGVINGARPSVLPPGASCKSPRLSACPPTRPPACRSTRFHVHPTIHPSVRPPRLWPIHPLAHTHVCQPVSLFKKAANLSFQSLLLSQFPSGNFQGSGLVLVSTSSPQQSSKPLCCHNSPKIEELNCQGPSPCCCLLWLSLLTRSTSPSVLLHCFDQPNQVGSVLMPSITTLLPCGRLLCLISLREDSYVEGGFGENGTICFYPSSRSGGIDRKLLLIVVMRW